MWAWVVAGLVLLGHWSCPLRCGCGASSPKPILSGPALHTCGEGWDHLSGVQQAHAWVIVASFPVRIRANPLAAMFSKRAEPAFSGPGQLSLALKFHHA